MAARPRFHHLALAVYSIERSFEVLRQLGYDRLGPIVADPQQGVRLAFAEGDGAPPPPRIELIEPLGESSVVRGRLSATGSGPYHCCFEVDDLDATIADLEAAGHRLLGPPAPSPLMTGRGYAFLYHRDGGLVELVAARASGSADSP